MAKPSSNSQTKVSTRTTRTNSPKPLIPKISCISKSF